LSVRGALRTSFDVVSAVRKVCPSSFPDLAERAVLGGDLERSTEKTPRGNWQTLADVEFDNRVTELAIFLGKDMDIDITDGELSRLFSHTGAGLKK
jgi:hypothetical protein